MEPRRERRLEHPQDLHRNLRDALPSAPLPTELHEGFSTSKDKFGEWAGLGPTPYCQAPERPYPHEETGRDDGAYGVRGGVFLERRAISYLGNFLLLDPHCTPDS